MSNVGAPAEQATHGASGEQAAEAIARLGAFEALAAVSVAEQLSYVVLDVFSETPLEGNQLAVFTDARTLEGTRMQSLARELKLSESVFVLPAQGAADVRVRIFTPGAELAFAGHPVLGSAVLLACALGRERVALETGAGVVEVQVQIGPRGGSGWMSQPLPRWRAYEREQELLAALGVERSVLPVELYDNGSSHVFVELDSEQAVAALAPDLRALEALGDFTVSCSAGSGARWKTRVFAPAVGVPEDPATGSAAGPLAVHLARHAQIAFGEEIEITQGAEIDRPSLLRALVRGSAERLEAVEVGGAAVIVAAGSFAA